MSPKSELAKGLTEDQILALADNPESIKIAAERIKAQRRAEHEAKVAEERKAARGRSMEAAANGRRRTLKARSTGVAWFDELDTEGQMRAIAEANLKAYGTIIPPIETKLMSLEKACPECKKIKPVLSGFGLRFYRGAPRAQSHCKSCRNEVDYHQRNAR